MMEFASNQYIENDVVIIIRKYVLILHLKLTLTKCFVQIRPKDDEKNRSKISEPTWLTSSEIINPVNKSDTSFSITRQEVLSSNLPTENNAVIFNNNNKNKQSKRQPQTE
jgi:hypothetical protein